jgi:predicted helicase
MNEKDLKLKNGERRNLLNLLAALLSKNTRELAAQVLELIRNNSRKKNSNRYFEKIKILFDNFKQTIYKDLSDEEFSRLYSQCITFGLLLAAISSEKKSKVRYDDILSYDGIRSTPAIFRDVLKSVTVEKVPLAISGIIDTTADQIHRREVHRLFQSAAPAGSVERVLTEPLFYFYETFLKSFDPETRKCNGVYYTPPELVLFMVRAVHRLAIEQLKMGSGLAECRILDPATGTSVFLAGALAYFSDELIKAYGNGFADATGEFLNNHLCGFEKMIIPYTLGHYLLLKLTGKQKNTEEPPRTLNLFPTDALDYKGKTSENGGLIEPNSFTDTLHRTDIAKHEWSYNVIVGNPPYANGNHCRKQTLPAKKSHIDQLLAEYRQIDGKSLDERNYKPLSDDYVRFTRLAQEYIRKNGHGIVAMVTNNTYLDGPTFRGMRHSLLQTFDTIYIVDLNGNGMRKEKGSDDENVFGIKQGIAISFFIKTGDRRTFRKSLGRGCSVNYCSVPGKKDSKLSLLGSVDFYALKWEEIFPSYVFYRFKPEERNTRLVSEYKKFIRINEIFYKYSVGLVTGRDRLSIRHTDREAMETVKRFMALKPEAARVEYSLGKDRRDWTVEGARQDLAESGLSPARVVPILYRPFDIRYTYYTGKSRGFHCMPRPGIMNSMIRENLALVSVRQVANGAFNHVFASEHIVESRVTTSNRGISYVFPLYNYYRHSNGEMRPVANISSMMTDKLLNMGYLPGVEPEIIFYYVYGILFAAPYREKYVDYLKTDFPAIPFPIYYPLYKKVSKLGYKLLELHLFKSPELNNSTVRFEGRGGNIVVKLRYVPESEEQPGRLYINNTQYFTHIEESVWNYMLCGYQVMRKYLSVRQRLSSDDIVTTIKMARAIQLTIHYSKEISEMYPEIESRLIEV